MRIGFGCVNLGSVSGGRSFGDDVRLLEAAIDAGVEVLDTADAYANGASERIVGRAIRTRRDRVEVATKGGYLFRERSGAEIVGRRLAKSVRDRVRPAAPAPAPADEPGATGGSATGSRYVAQDFSPTALRRALDASLQRLHTDHVDVYQLHGPPHLLPDLVGELADLVTAGKVRRFGVGAESIRSAAEWSDVAGIDVVQLPVGVLDAYAVETAVEVSARGREVWARGVFAGGVLAAAHRDPTLVQRDPKGPLISGLLEVAARHDIGIFALALGFVRSIPGISTVLLGMSTPEHLRRNLELFAAPALAPQVLADVWALLAPDVDADGGAP
jgi:aryl-alcohol dehydrogenase-like predicted oxidoreductase